MTFMKIGCLVLFLIISYTVNSQQLAQKMADKFFDNLSYVSAVDYYKDLAKGKNAKEMNIRRLALCYYKLQDFKEAGKAYETLLSMYPQTTAEEDLLNYIQCLKHQERYEEVKSVLLKLSVKNPKSSVAEVHKMNPNYVTELKKDSTNYKIHNVRSLNTIYSEFFPYMDKKQKSMLLVSNRRNVSVKNKTFAFDNTYFTDTYIAKQEDSLKFGTPELLSSRLSTNYHDGPVVFSADENTMYLTRTNYLDKKLGESTKHIVNLKLLIFKKDEKGEWGDGVAFPFCSDEYSLGHAALSKDGQRLYFISDMPGGLGQTDIWYSDWVGGSWKKPVNPGFNVNTEGQEMFPFINTEGILFFASNGYAGLGGLDICYAFPNEAAFLEAKVLNYPINTRFDDFGFYVNPDLKTGYFSSNREGGKGKDDIYYFNSALPLFGIYAEGNVLNAYSKKNIRDVKVRLLNQNRQVLDSVMVGADGRYHLTIPDPSKDYNIEVKESDAYAAQSVSLKALKPGKNEQDLLLYPKYTISCHVTEGKTHAALDSVKATLTDLDNNTHKNYVTNAGGNFKDLLKDKKAGDNVRYTIKLEKPGFITSVQNVDLVLDTTRLIDLNKIINAGLEKMEKGTDIGKIVKINPIYYDLGKWDIKPEAAAELDKIANVMKENPTMKIELGSHTDCRSSKAYNMSLSDKRAKTSASYIVSKGIDKSRIYGKGYGETKLINACECEGTKVVPCTEEQHQQNRRTEFIVVKF